MQKFGNNSDKKSDNSNKTNTNRYKLTGAYKLYLIFTAVFITIIMIFLQDKSRVIYCNNTQNYCELQITTRAGFKHSKPLCRQEDIINITAEHDLRKKLIDYLRNKNSAKRYYYTIYVKCKNSDKIPVFTKSGYNYYYEEEKMMNIVNDLNYLLENSDKDIEYDIIKGYNN